MQNVTTWRTWKPASAPTPEELLRATLRAIWDLHTSYSGRSGNDEQWLWRGQANGEHGLDPAIHTRVRRSVDLTDENVKKATSQLIGATREAGLDCHESTTLPDLALLAMLQHYGAATPLLDVSLDPVVALYMAVVSPNPYDLKRDGAIFAIRRPTKNPIARFDSRRHIYIYEKLPAAGVVTYEAPDVSERLRIQRGLFLIGKVSVSDNSTMPLTFEIEGEPSSHWLEDRLNAHGAGWPAAAKTEVAVISIPSSIKKGLQKWLEERSGMTTDFVYPTRWHQPHFEQFAKSHGRTSDLTLPSAPISSH